jgi:hypothetical protein
MYAIKTTAFFRPNSRPSSPAPAPLPRPDSGVASDRTPRPPNRLSLVNFRRHSPATDAHQATVPSPLIQDGSYLEMLSLKFNEAVSKALAQPTAPALAGEQLVGGRRPIPAGRGNALGALLASYVIAPYVPAPVLRTSIYSELHASRDNPHLFRATIRCLHRPLTVLLTNLSAHLLPLLASSAFSSPQAPTIQAPLPNPTQAHALALATFASELLDKFDELGLGLDSDPRGDGLKAVREGLVSVITRVVTPLVNGIRNELLPIVEALAAPTPPATKSLPGSKSTAVYHPSIVTLQGVMIIYARAMSRYTSSLRCQPTLATFLISIVWRALVALSHRPYRPPRPVEPRTPPTTPPVTPGSSRFIMKLPPSRPPSPPTPQGTSTASADAAALYELFSLFPRPAAAKETTRLACEAVDEAFDGLKAFSSFLKAVYTPHIDPIPNADLEALTADIPTLIALPVLLQAFPPSSAVVPVSVSSMLGMNEDEYRKGCLAGFARAEECAGAVGQRVLDVLSPDTVVATWLEAEVADDVGDDP